jgi:hypothetical protein
MNTLDKPLSILASACDKGGALQTKAFVAHCIKNNPEVSFSLLANGPAYPIFEETGLTVRENDPEAILSELDSFNPDFVLMGLSYPNQPTDDVLVRKSRERDIPCGSIQDYWGYLGDLKQLPPYFFVMDRMAEDLTLKRTHGEVNCVITGSPKHEAYKDQIADFRKVWIDNDNVPTLTFFGQPRELPGFLENLEIFVETLNEIPAPIRLQFKPHPNEANDEAGFQGFYRDIFKKQPHTLELVPVNSQAESYLVNSDVVVCCFSTTGLDHNYLQLYTAEPIGSLIYLAIGEQIRKSIQAIVGVDTIPGASQGLGTMVANREALLNALMESLVNQQTTTNYFNAVHKHLSVNDSPSQNVLSAMRNIVSREEPS